MLTLALRNVFRHRGRTVMTLAAIAFGVASLILTGGFIRDIYFQLAEALIHSQSGHLQILRAGYFEGGARSPERFLIERSEPLRQAILALPGVQNVMARVAFSGLLNNGRTDLGVIGEGVEADRETSFGSHVRIIAGRQLADRDKYGILVGQGVAQALKIAPADHVTLLLNTSDGALNSMEFEVVGVFQSFSKDYDARAIRIPLPTAQDLLSSSGVNALVVALGSTSETDAVANAVKTLLSGQQLEIRTWVQLNDFYEKTVALYDRQFGVLQVIVLALVVLGVANTINMNTFERVGEFGTMMALGNRGNAVAWMVLTENALLGLIGSTLGVLIGVVLALVISSIGIPMPPPPNANLGYTASIRVVPVAIATAFVIGVAATVLAALLPIFRVSRLSVADALRTVV